MEQPSTDKSPQLPLEGVRILEMGQLLAGPFASMLLGWFGAEVIKIEPPQTGDPLRNWRKVYRGTSLWWYSLSRNKKSVTLNLKTARGQEIARQLVSKVDVVMENFKPGTLEKWGLGYEDLKKINPRLIMARISGYGQTGPFSHKPGYANVAEGFSGMRYVTGFPDKPPSRANLSMGDTLAGLHAALGILLSLYHRDAQKSGEGQMVDVAIYEACFNLMESLIPEFDKLGEIRERQGAKLTGIVPSNTYPTKDGRYIIIGGNGDSIFHRLMIAAGRADLANDPRLANNEGRVKHEPMIDAALTEWASNHNYDELISELEKADVPSGPILNAAEIASHPHYIERGMFEDFPLSENETVKLPTFSPKLSETPGQTNWIGPSLGAHNRDVYLGMLEMNEEEIVKLMEEGVI
ncbi:MAG: CaiB/BaiF CoA transferase family protein [Blastocatellales bacterium]